jgi:hypothetical protein
MPAEDVVNTEDLVRHHHARPTTLLNRPDHHGRTAVDLDVFGVRLQCPQGKRAVLSSR